MPLQVLTVGTHPNLAFYAWRLQATKACAVTMVSGALDPSAAIRWQSSHLGNSKFAPVQVHADLGSLSRSGPQYDVVILSVSNLQSFQDTCTKLGPFLHAGSVIVVESTGYVQLEPFVASSYPKQKAVTVCSIMNEADVKRQPGSNVFSHRVVNSDQRIYLGTCTDESKSLYKVGDSENYAKFYKALQMVQEQSRGCVSLLKSNNYKEFMTYQWKLALPRVVLDPLSVIFEEPFPAALEKQILAKPLVSGLVNEIFKIIKKMECKLIKGFENESNIMKNWAAHYPATTKTDASVSDSGPAYASCNSVFYNFYHRLDVDVDLLLLQPILLGDDYGVRTPYLENLYSIVCQLLKMNFADSLFFARKGKNGASGSGESSEIRSKIGSEIDAATRELSDLRLEKENCETEVRERQSRVEQIESSLAQRQRAHDALVHKFEDQARLYEAKLSALDASAREKAAAVAAWDAKIEKQREIEKNQERERQREREIQSQSQAQSQAQSQVQSQNEGESQGGAQVAKRSHTYDLSHMDTPDLSDLAHVAAYGDALNGEQPQPAAPVSHIPPTQTPHNSVSQPAAPPAAPPVAQTYVQDDNTGINASASANAGASANPAESAMSDKERELFRREQAILERERELRHAYPGPGPVQQNEPYYDAQGAEPPYHDAYAYHNNNNNASYAGQQYSSQNYRPAQSLTGSNPYGQPYEQGYDQRPPHGLPANGFPQNALPNTLRNPQRYQQRARMMSGASHSNGYPQNAQNMQNMPPPNMQGRSMSQMSHMGHAMPPAQQSGSQQYLMAQGNAPAQNFPASGKRNNRRSAFPDQALNIDYGGRGGMPMPTASGAKKHVSSSPPVPAILPHKKSFVANTNAQALSNNHLRINQNTSSNSDSLTSHGSMAEDVPKPSTPDSTRDITLEVPAMEKAGKPLGGIAAPVEEKKKKRGLFR